MEKVISSFRGGDPTIGWGLLSKGKAPIPITDLVAWHTYATALYDVPRHATSDES